MYVCVYTTDTECIEYVDDRIGVSGRCIDNHYRGIIWKFCGLFICYIQLHIQSVICLFIHNRLAPKLYQGHLLVIVQHRVA